MLNTGEDIFLSFLDGIRRTKQSVVKRDKFVRIWNDWALPEWVNSNLSFQEGFELSTKQLNDLQGLLVITDGKDDYGNGIVHPIAINNTSKLFPLPIFTTTLISINLETMKTMPFDYPKYKRSIAVWFTEGGEWKKAYPYKEIDSYFLEESVYSKPSSNIPYYKIRNNKIEPVGNTNVIAMKLSYIRYPNIMIYTTGVISYDIDLGKEQIEEIRDIAVRLYLERVSDQRYKSFLMEETVKSISQK